MMTSWREFEKPEEMPGRASRSIRAMGPSARESAPGSASESMRSNATTGARVESFVEAMEEWVRL